MRNRTTRSKDGVKDAQSNHSLERWANPTLARERSVLLRGSLGVAERGPSNVAAGGWVRRTHEGRDSGAKRHVVLVLRERNRMVRGGWGGFLSREGGNRMLRRLGRRAARGGAHVARTKRKQTGKRAARGNVRKRHVPLSRWPAPLTPNPNPKT